MEHYDGNDSVAEARMARYAMRIVVAIALVGIAVFVLTSLK
jgi:hypothetical protein